MKGILNHKSIIQHHRAVQPHTWLDRALSRPQTAHKARQCLEKQLEKADPFTVVVCGSDIWKYIHQALCLCDKIKLPVMGDKTGFRRSSHILWLYSTNADGIYIGHSLFNKNSHCTMYGQSMNKADFTHKKICDQVVHIVKTNRTRTKSVDKDKTLVKGLQSKLKISLDPGHNILSIGVHTR